MDRRDRRIKGLTFALSDLEASLKQAGRLVGAAGLASVARNIDASAPDDFLAPCREMLESILLGERDLPSEALGLVLDIMAEVDELMWESQRR